MLSIEILVTIRYVSNDFRVTFHWMKEKAQKFSSGSFLKVFQDRSVSAFLKKKEFI